jgi:gamma-glutamyltranspeptidase / glutathione hydrolase
LYWLVQICRQILYSNAPDHERITRTHAQKLWQRMSEKGGMVGPMLAKQGTHSDYVVAVDSERNVAALCHTINTAAWGTTGIFVNGISIPDSASTKQDSVAEVGRGGYLYSTLNPLIVLRNGRPFLASSSTGNGMSEVTFQCLLALLGRGVDLQSAVSMPLVHAADYYDEVTRYASLIGSGVSAYDAWATILRDSAQLVEEGFDPVALKDAVSLGLKMNVRAPTKRLAPKGYWAGISIDPETGEIQGWRTRAFAGTIEKLP